MAAATGSGSSVWWVLIIWRAISVNIPPAEHPKGITFVALTCISSRIYLNIKNQCQVADTLLSFDVKCHSPVHRHHVFDRLFECRFRQQAIIHTDDTCLGPNHRQLSTIHDVSPCATCELILPRRILLTRHCPKEMPPMSNDECMTLYISMHVHHDYRWLYSWGCIPLAQTNRPTFCSLIEFFALLTYRYIVDSFRIVFDATAGIYQSFAAQYVRPTKKCKKKFQQ